MHSLPVFWSCMEVVYLLLKILLRHYLLLIKFRALHFNFKILQLFIKKKFDLSRTVRSSSLQCLGLLWKNSLIFYISRARSNEIQVFSIRPILLRFTIKPLSLYKFYLFLPKLHTSLKCFKHTIYGIAVY